MNRIGIPFKVALGYLLLAAIVCLATWLVHGNMRNLARIDETEREMIARSSTADSLMLGFINMYNNSQAVIIGASDDMTDFDRSLASTIAAANRLRAMTEDSLECQKIDSLKILLFQKRENTLLIRAALTSDSAGAYYDKRLAALEAGIDSVIIRQTTANKSSNSETVYEVVKSRKGFFSRLGDAFRKQHTDTISMRRDTTSVVTDSVQNDLNIASPVANVLADIRKEEKMLRKMRRENLRKQETELRQMGIDMTMRMEEIIGELRYDGHRAIQNAIREDNTIRREAMMKMLMIAVTSVLLAIILLVNIWRDTARARRDRKRIERAKEETERIMQQRERLLLTITHDIKAPAASISGFIELLDGHVQGAKPTSYLTSIKSSANHLLHLVSELLDYHQLEKGKITAHASSFSASQLISGSAEEMRPQAEAKGLTLEYDVSGCDNSKDMCRGDAYRIRQILENLISNAIKYTKEGGITVTASTDGVVLKFSVSDTGQGMTPEESGEIFSAFTRLKGAQGIEGVGLGLSITKELVTILKGDIRLTSEKDKGTTFFVEIPVETSSADEATESEERTVQPTARKTVSDSRKILVIDDDALQLRLLGEMLSRLTGGEWETVSCQKVNEGLQKLKEDRFAIVITDIEMPEMNGRDLIGKINSQDIIIIGMTAHGEDIAPTLQADGFDACLFKPFTIETLSSTLSSATGIAFEEEQKDEAPEDDKPFAALTAFAGGDKDAEREILTAFKTDMSQSREALDKALQEGDLQKISSIAHKISPTMDMVSAKTAGRLRELSAEKIKTLSGTEIKAHVDEILKEMSEYIQILP